MRRTLALAVAALSAASALRAGEPKLIARKIAGAHLGMSVKEAAALKPAEPTKLLANMARPGERILVLSAAKEKGAAEFLGHFRGENLRRVEWTYAKDSDWSKLIDEKTKAYGTPALRQEKVEGGARDTAEWNDGKTRLALVREPRADGAALFGSLEDVAMSQPSSEPRLVSKPVPSETVAQCLDANACYDLALAHAGKGHCEEALKIYSRAIELKPDHPWAWHDRALIKRAMGDEEGAKTDFAQALARKAAASDFTLKALEDPKAKFGPQWSCSNQ